MDFAVEVLGHENQHFAADTASFPIYTGVPEAVPAFVFVQLLPYRGPGGRPEVAVFFPDVEISAAAVNRHIIVPVPGDAPQPGVLVEAIATCRIGYQRKEFLVTRIIYPGARRLGCSDHIFPVRVVKTTVSHKILRFRS